MKILYKSNDCKIFTVSDNCTNLIDLPKDIYDEVGTIIDFFPIEDNETVISKETKTKGVIAFLKNFLIRKKLIRQD